MPKRSIKSPGPSAEASQTTGLDTFGARLQHALAIHDRSPETRHGRLTWLRNELLAKTGVEVTVESVRKWTANEVVPRPGKITALAQTLGVDEAWLSVGRVPTSTPVEQRAGARAATGATLYVAGLLELSDVAVAFPDPNANPGVHLYAISAGRQVSISVAVARESGTQLKFYYDGSKPTGAVLGIVPGSRRGTFAIYDLTTADFQERGGYCEALLERADDAQRLIQKKPLRTCERVRSLHNPETLGQ